MKDRSGHAKSGAREFASLPLETPATQASNDLKPSRAGVSDSTNLSEMIADDHKNLGHVGQIETLPIFPIRPRTSQIIGDVFDLWFALVARIWDGRETAKSPIVWDFPDI